MSAPYLELRGLGKSYDGRTRALDNVSLTAAKGEFITFLGPSGSGKTTTLMLVAGFESASEGDILIEGRSIGRVPPHKRGIGVVFQNYALFPHRTAAENVAFPLLMRKMPKAQAMAKAAEMLGLVGLERFGGRYPREMSGGQQQRVALARALVFDPALLLLDEPLGALDKNLREQMQIEIKAVQRRLGVTTIFVTHDQSEAMAMSDRIVVFDGGRIQQVGAPLDIYRYPSSSFVARFVGDSNIPADRPGRWPGRDRRHRRRARARPARRPRRRCHRAAAATGMPEARVGAGQCRPADRRRHRPFRRQRPGHRPCRRYATPRAAGRSGGPRHLGRGYIAAELGDFVQPCHRA